jgi:hypothetical protein
MRGFAGLAPPYTGGSELPQAIVMIGDRAGRCDLGRLGAIPGALHPRDIDGSTRRRAARLSLPKVPHTSALANAFLGHTLRADRVAFPDYTAAIFTIESINGTQALVSRTPPSVRAVDIFPRATSCWRRRQVTPRHCPPGPRRTRFANWPYRAAGLVDGMRAESRYLGGMSPAGRRWTISSRCDRYRRWTRC